MASTPAQPPEQLTLPKLIPSEELVLILQRSYRNERTRSKLHPTFETPEAALKWLKSHTTRYASLF